ncbi:MAG: arylamine N-acetyltransferase [Ruminococcaceae bacterium]|nr:arylamine N-acetyltransferase [Oscillospiraceae bacterium]
MKISDIIPSARAQAYFNRIGFNFDRNMSEKDFFNGLQYAHVTTVPYENLDILNHIPLKLDPDSLYEKIVVNRRGGYCFELNGLFGWLLKDLGFEVHDYFGRYLRGESDTPMRRHRVLKVVGEENTYICDVGIANLAPRHPLLFTYGEIQEQFGESYRIENEPFFGNVVYLKHNSDKWERFFSFTEEEQLDKDYVYASYYLENAPDSIFNVKEMVAIKTPNGRKVIDGKMFRIYDEKNMDIPVASPEMMRDLLEIHYGIKL